MPRSRPVSLRPTLLRDEYRALADEINAKMAWNSFSFEMMCFYATALFAPPFAVELMVNKYNFDYARLFYVNSFVLNHRIGFAPSTKLLDFAIRLSRAKLPTYPRV